MKKSVLTAAALGALVVSSITACGNDAAKTVAADCKPAASFQTLNAGTLTVAVPELPPFSTYANSQLAGVDGQLIKEFAKRNCLEIKAEPTSYAGTIPAVQSSRADVAIGAYYRTSERDKIVGLTSPVYTDEMATVSTDGIDQLPALESRNVGTGDGYLWVPDLKTLLGDKLTIYPSAVEMQADLKAGRIDTGIDSYGSAVEMYKGEAKYKVAAVQPDARVKASKEPAQIAFPYIKSNSGLGAALDATITSMKSDGTIGSALKGAGLPETGADTGAPRLIG
jgi:polar amino acid transport system substrate-binding protein